MSKITLEIVTPEGAVFSEDVDEVILPGTMGEIGVLPGHVPLMTTLNSGRLIAISEGDKHRFAVHGGFAEILPEKVVILTEASELAGEIDAERAKAAISSAEEALKQAEVARGEEVGEADPMELHRAALERARARLVVSEDKD
jgi:F-type H+-transporting ATPase subunit epsilon